MAGLYIHIPFCRKACYYCDFHFVASLRNKKDMVKAIIEELEQRKKEWTEYDFDTVYFGGGTPSVLDIEDIKLICSAIFQNYNIKTENEFTIEANPDDLNLAYLDKLHKHTKINRFSLGVQSFDDSILKFLNRRHDAKQAIKSINNLKKVGYKNVTLDLIYGIPGLSSDVWLRNLQVVDKLDIPHLSAYHLTIEPKTVFSVWQKKSKFNQITEDESLAHYEILTTFASENGYDHYEISNFAKYNMYSRHNTSYWRGTPYLGIGPSAHSFKQTRRWNIANNSKYIQSLINDQKDYYNYEELSKEEMYNDYILTSLRTKWGASWLNIENIGEKYLSHSKKILKKIYDYENIKVHDSGFQLTEKGWFIADYLISEFFIV